MSAWAVLADSFADHGTFSYPEALGWSLVSLLLLVVSICLLTPVSKPKKSSNQEHELAPPSSEEVKPVLASIRNRRSIFPKSYIKHEIPPTVVESMLHAASWAPFHGSLPPWRFVVLGKKAMVEMQQLSLDFYDKHWEETGWANGVHGSSEEYLKWRQMTDEEITGRWEPCSYMIAIVMQRQAGSKRMPEWEEAAATACAAQNMLIQASSFPGVA